MVKRVSILVFVGFLLASFAGCDSGNSKIDLEAFAASYEADAIVFSSFVDKGVSKGKALKEDSHVVAIENCGGEKGNGFRALCADLLFDVKEAQVSSRKLDCVITENIKLLTDMNAENSHKLAVILEKMFEPNLAWESGESRKLNVVATKRSGSNRSFQLSCKEISKRRALRSLEYVCCSGEISERMFEGATEIFNVYLSNYLDKWMKKTGSSMPAACKEGLVQFYSIRALDRLFETSRYHPEDNYMLVLEKAKEQNRSLKDQLSGTGDKKLNESFPAEALLTFDEARVRAEYMGMSLAFVSFLFNCNERGEITKTGSGDVLTRFLSSEGKSLEDAIRQIPNWIRKFMVFTTKNRVWLEGPCIHQTCTRHAASLLR